MSINTKLIWCIVYFIKIFFINVGINISSMIMEGFIMKNFKKIIGFILLFTILVPNITLVSTPVHEDQIAPLCDLEEMPK